MADGMLFPKTWEEFEKQYGFYDIKQSYTFGNTRLIPSFRVQQWLYHLDDIKRKKQSQKNKMAEVASIFGKKLDEQFYINSHKRKRIARFTVFGLSVLDEVANPCEWNLQYALLNDLLTGEAVIVDENRG